MGLFVLKWGAQSITWKKEVMGAKKGLETGGRRCMGDRRRVWELVQTGWCLVVVETGEG